MKKRNLLILAAISIITMGVLNNYHVTLLQKTEKYISQQILRELDAIKNFDIQFESIEVEWISSSLKNVTINHPALQKELLIPEISIYLSLTDLLLFQLRFNVIIVPETYVEIYSSKFLNSLKSVLKKENIKISKTIKNHNIVGSIKKTVIEHLLYKHILKLLNSNFFKRITILNTSIRIMEDMHSHKLNIASKRHSFILLRKMKLQLDIRRKGLDVDLYSPSIQIHIKQAKHIHNFITSAETNLALREKNIKINLIKIKNPDIDMELHEKGRDVYLKISTQIKNILRIKSYFYPEHTLDMDIQGSVQADLRWVSNQFEFSVNGRSILINSVDLGSAHLKGTLDKKNIQFKTASLKSKSWWLQLKPFQIVSTSLLDKDIFLEGEIKSFSLAPLLKDQLKLEHYGIHLTANGIAKCSIKFKSFFAKCDLPTIEVESISIKPKSISILKTPLFKDGQMQLTVDEQKVEWISSVRHKESTLTSNGKVFFKQEKMSVNYQVHYKDLSDISLFTKKLSGTLTSTGVVSGWGSLARFSGTAKVNNFFIENEAFGEARFDITSFKQKTNFFNIDGRIEETKYKGSVKVSYPQKTITSKVDLVNINTNTINKWLPEKFKMNGKQIDANINITNSLTNIKKIQSVQALVKGNNVLFGKWYFRSINVSVSKTQDEVDYRFEVESQKNYGNIYAKGVYTPQGKISINLKGDSLEVTQLQWIIEQDIQLQMATSFNFNITGTLNKPLAKGKIWLKKTNVRNNPLPDSLIELEYKNHSLKATLNLFKNTISGKLHFSNKTQSIKHLELGIKNWNFALWLPTITPLSNINSNLSARVSLVQKNNKYTGSISIDKLDFLNYALSARKKDFTVSVDNNKITAPHLLLLNQQNNNTLSIKPYFSKNNYAVDVVGQIDLVELNDLSREIQFNNGKIKLELQIEKKEQFLTNGLIEGQGISIIPSQKLEDISNLNFKASIKENTINLNRLDAIVGEEGSVSMAGQIDLSNTLPVSLSGYAKNTKLSFGQSSFFIADWDLQFKGSLKNYKLLGSCKVQSGQIKELVNIWAKDITLSKGSYKQYLPPNITQIAKNNLLRPSLDIKFKLIKPFPLDLDFGNFEINTNALGTFNVKNDLESPLIQGKIYTDTGQVKVQKQVLNITAAELDLHNTTIANGVLNASLNGNIEQYKVDIIGRGPINQLNFLLTSQPYLTKEQIAFLIVFGKLPISEQKEIREASLDTSYDILLHYLENYFKISEKFNFDIKLGIEKQSLDTTTDDTSSENLRVRTPKIILEKQINSKIFGKAVKTFGNNAKHSFELKYKVNNNVSLFGEWENNEVESGSENNNIEFGVEYDVEFK